MDAKDIFQKVNEHQLQGIMFHNDMDAYFTFLSLDGYASLHRYHCLEEVIGEQKLKEFFITHYNLLLPIPAKIEKRQIIPISWNSHNRYDVTINDCQNGVKDGFNRWIKWEQETKKLYNESYASLLENKENCSAVFFQQYLEDIDEELKQAETILFHLKTMNYDMAQIVDVQKEYVKKYSKAFKIK